MSLVERLAQWKGRFGAEAAERVAALLERLKRARVRDPAQLIELHETVLFLRAYPQNARVLELAEEILQSFAARLKGLDHTEFEYAEVSGIAGTGLTTNFSYPFAKSLSDRHAGCIGIDWARYEHADRLGPILARLIPEAFEDWAIAPHPDWRRWYEQASGTLPWLIEGVTPEVYDLLELPLRWELGDSAASRTRARFPLDGPRENIFFHDGPFLTRKDVSIEAEFASPKIKTRRLLIEDARAVLNVIVDASAVRYRELYGFLYPDLANVFHADLGRGSDLYFFGVPRKWHLPKRSYRSGMYFKNGVPIGYVEVMELHGRMEVGFNLYYTFRQGETAWLYGRLLKLFHEQYRVTSFVIDAYQLGHENEEAIEAGAFWFYYRLGFRPEAEEVRAIALREAAKIARQAGYRTPARTLRRLAKSEMVYQRG
jgi:hypothetical protein